MLITGWGGVSLLLSSNLSVFTRGIRGVYGIVVFEIQALSFSAIAEPLAMAGREGAQG